MDLFCFGWSDERAALLTLAYPESLAGRISAEHRGSYRMLCAHGELAAEIDGKMRHAARCRSDYPAVGDWVAFSQRDDAHAVLHGILPRANAIVRKAAGSALAEQIIAANVDVLFLMTALDGDFNMRRVERYVTLAWDSGAQPVIVLNKADLCGGNDDRETRLASMGWNLPIHRISALTNDGCTSLGPYCAPGKTVAIVGSSGVGKSTLLNRLLGGEERDRPRSRKRP